MTDNYYEWFKSKGLNPIKVPSTSYQMYSAIKQEGGAFNKICNIVGKLNDYLQNGDLPQEQTFPAVIGEGNSEIKTSLSASLEWGQGLVSFIKGGKIGGNYSGDAVLKIKFGDVFHDEVFYNQLHLALEKAKITDSDISDDISKNDSIYIIVDLWKSKSITMSIWDKKAGSITGNMDAEILKSDADFEHSYEKKDEIPWNNDNLFMPFAYKIVNVVYDRESKKFRINNIPQGGLGSFTAHAAGVGMPHNGAHATSVGSSKTGFDYKVFERTSLLEEKQK